MKNFSAGRSLCLVMAITAIFLLLFHAHSPGHPLDPALAMAALLPETALTRINLLTEEAWTPNQADIENSQVDAATFSSLLRGAASLGAPLVSKITDPKKDWGDVRIYWPDFCGQEATECDAEDNLCGDLAADPSPLASQDYGITQCLNDKFSISESDFAGSWMDMQNFLVREQNQRVVNIVNKLNEKAILFMHANAGLNKGGQFTVNGGNQYEVPSAEFDDTMIMTKMLLDAEASNVRNPKLITGNPTAFLTFKNAQFEAANGEGKGNAARAGAFGDITLDIRGFMKVPTLAGSIFAVTPYAVAFASKNYYSSSTPVYDPDLKKWKYFIRIPAYGLTIDVLHQRVCESGRKDRWNHVFNYSLNYDFFNNPRGCLDEDSGKRVTGIIEYLNTGYSVS